ncbi:sperm motility kinase 3A-like [Clytia hemisphaerica]|uniref:sperm motility kinase 3A-like n=1 Tax=Clytia hemisphaerica TaxID=252671 RepID=UPI0034D585A5
MPTSRGMAPIIMELNAMNLLKGCQNVVQMLDFFQGENHCYLVMELCKEDLMTTLNERMHTKPNIREIFTQTLNGVHQCHLKSIAHCDLKLENVLINQDGAVKITDFGLGMIPSSPGNGCQKFCGTPEYMAPEVHRGYVGFDNTPYDPFKADMWSLGAILYAMLTGKFLPINWSKDLFVSDELHDLLTKLLNHDPASRPSTSEIINHPWLTPSPSAIEAKSANSVKKEQKEVAKTVSQYHQVSVNKALDEKVRNIMFF